MPAHPACESPVLSCSLQKGGDDDLPLVVLSDAREAAHKGLQVSAVRLDGTGTVSNALPDACRLGPAVGSLTQPMPALPWRAGHHSEQPRRSQV